jgi:hypothetical protein
VTIWGIQLIGIDGLMLAITAVVIVATLRTRTKPVTSPPLPGGQEGSAREWRAQRRLAANRGEWIAAAGMAWILAGVWLLAGSFAVSPRFSAFLVACGALAWVAGSDPERLLPTLPVPRDETADAKHARPLSDSLRRAGLVVSLTLTVAVWTMNRDRAVEESHADILVLWLLAIALMVVAALLPIRLPALGSGEWLARHREPMISLGAVAMLALGLRVWALDRYPWTFSGDEAQFAFMARRFLDEGISDPFGTGWFSQPVFFPFIQSLGMRMLGVDPAGARLVSALFGAAAVVAMYIYVRRQFGAGAAVVAGTLLATMPYHVFFSRQAMNNVGDTLALPLILLFVDRAVVARRPVDAVLAGLLVGAAQGFYTGARILIPVAVVVTVLTWVAVYRPWTELRRSLSRAGIVAAWGLAGFAVGVAPFAAHAADHWEEVQSRTRFVSIFSGDWLEREQEATGASAASIIWGQFEEIALLAFHGTTKLHFNPGKPMAGWALVIPAAFGLALTTICWYRRRFVGLAVSYWAVVAAVALTVEPNQASRLVLLGPIISALAAVGVEAARRDLTRMLRVPVWAGAGVVATGVIVGALWQVNFYFKDDNQVRLYSDHNTQVANTLGRELRSLGQDARVYFAGPPRMWYDGFPNIRFLAPDAIGLSLEEPLSAGSERLTVEGLTLFVFLPERVGELEVVRRWYPDGELREIHGTVGELLYYEYRVDPHQELVEDSAASPTTSPTPSPTPTAVG